ncbi:hypothetical protein SK128_028537, partial [Halocaridina rubra]
SEEKWSPDITIENVSKESIHTFPSSITTADRVQDDTEIPSPLIISVESDELSQLPVKGFDDSPEVTDIPSSLDTFPTPVVDDQEPRNVDISEKYPKTMYDKNVVI